MKTKQATSSIIDELWMKTERAIQESTSLEEAAQKLVYGIYSVFSESVVITRVFFTVPFNSLPASNQSFVKNLAESDGP